MNVKQIIASAGRNRHTIILTAREKDGTIETREAEPYSYRIEKGHQYFYCYDIHKQGVRKFLVSGIISVVETDNTFLPRWPVEI